MNFEIGSTVGDYQVVGILGAGGMGKVYKVRNVISDRIEAMKVLLPDLATEADLADRFLREIKVQASLEHPNIASLHTAQRVGNQLLMLMEFVEGATLEEKLKGGPLPMAQAVDYMRQVLGALDYAHQHGVVHRDIKPANMMLTPGGVVKLMDFGIAKAASDRRLTMTGTTMGSLYYMSPEQIQGAATLDSRSDLYSVGVSLYELLTGKRPFDGDSQFAIMAAHLEKTPVPPIELDPRLPKGLSDAILMAVSKDPNSRFQTAGAFRNALGNVAPAAMPTAPLAAPQVAPQAAAVADQPRGRRGLWMAMGAVAAVLAVVGVVELAPWKGAKAQEGVVPPVPTQSGSVPAQTAPPPVANPGPETGASTPPVETNPQPSTGQPGGGSTTPVRPPQGSVSRPDRASQAGGSQNPQPGGVSAPVAQQPAVTAPPIEMPQPSGAGQAPANAANTANTASAASREELQKVREDLMMVSTRAAGIRQSLQSLQAAQASRGLNLSGTLQEPANLMNNFLAGADQALQAGDAATAKSFMDKAERQVEKLEKLLNR